MAGVEGNLSEGEEDSHNESKPIEFSIMESIDEKNKQMHSPDQE